MEQSINITEFLQLETFQYFSIVVLTYEIHRSKTTTTKKTKTKLASELRLSTFATTLCQLFTIYYTCDANFPVRHMYIGQMNND